MEYGGFGGYSSMRLIFCVIWCEDAPAPHGVGKPLVGGPVSNSGRRQTPVNRFSKKTSRQSDFLGS